MKPPGTTSQQTLITSTTNPSEKTKTPKLKTPQLVEEEPDVSKPNNFGNPENANFSPDIITEKVFLLGQVNSLCI